MESLFWINFLILRIFFNAKERQLADLGLPPDLIAKVYETDWDLAEKDLAWVNQATCNILTCNDACYPKLLKETKSHPLLIFVRGNLDLLATHQIAIVGSRNPTSTGVAIAHEFAKELSGIGLTITSGLAMGIDAASHRGALAVSGNTIAVMGTGLDKIYPACNRRLADEIIDRGGALVSEFSPGTAARAIHFPMRNRIISGLSLGTLVVEATLRSGSLITARQAADQGREVFAIPGSIRNPLARGCHSIIRDGAKLVETIADIVEELGPGGARLLKQPVDPKNKVDEIKLENDCKKLLECIGYETTTVDVLAARSHFSIREVVAKLLILELQGLVKSVNGGYAKIR